MLWLFIALGNVTEIKSYGLWSPYGQMWDKGLSLSLSILENKQNNFMDKCNKRSTIIKQTLTGTSAYAFNMMLLRLATMSTKS